ncbi:MAG TPA: PilZ domain-containing protein [Enterovirga sp.]|jgi:hypothetical protein
MWGIFKSEKAPQYERRGYRREPIVAAAKIVFANGRSHSCVTANLSSTGAKVGIGKTVVLPESFELHVPDRNVRRKARVVWRSEDAVGLHFD